MQKYCLTRKHSGQKAKTTARHRRGIISLAAGTKALSSVIWNFLLLNLKLPRMRALFAKSSTLSYRKAQQAPFLTQNNKFARLDCVHH